MTRGLGAMSRGVAKAPTTPARRGWSDGRRLLTRLIQAPD